MLFLFYPLFLYIGYKVTTWRIIDPYALKISQNSKRKAITIADVKSQSRTRKKDDPVLLSVVRGPDPIKYINTALDLIGGISKIIKPGDKIVIKPNISGGNPDIPGSYTSIALIEELARLIKKAGGIVKAIVDSNMVWNDFESITEAQGWIKWAKLKGLPLINLRKTDCVVFDFGSSSIVETEVIPKIMIEADIIISITCNEDSPAH